MIKFVLCGTGWRAEFFVRIAKALPDLFAITAIYTRNEERAAEIKANRNIFATTELSKALSAEHDFVVVASGKAGFLELLQQLEARGEKIVTETTFSSLSDSDLDIASKINGYTLEQYWNTPLYSSIWKAISKIGKVDCVYLSALHNHHAASICRRIFPSRCIEHRKLFEDTFSCIKSGSRFGMVRTGEEEQYTRKINLLKMECGGTFINDFSSNQYHSYTIPSRIEIRGEKGVVTERGVSYINEEGYPINLYFDFHSDSGQMNQTLALSYVTLGSDIVFENRFYPLNFNSDEIAIASILIDIVNGKFDYTIADGVEDARLGRFL